MAVRIQLASNFQVVELTYDSWDEVVQEEVDEATAMVNKLGSVVVNEIKTKANKDDKAEKVEKASEKQIKFAISLGLSEDKANSMNKQEIWQWIQDKKNK